MRQEGHLQSPEDQNLKKFLGFTLVLIVMVIGGMMICVGVSMGL
jgi:hypothetical protein